MSHDHGHHDHQDHDHHDHDHHDHDHHAHGHAGRDHAGHGHGHSHHHHPAVAIDDWRYGVGIGLNLVFVVAEATAGVLSHSTALFADAGHNLSDVLGLALAGGAAWLARRPSGAQRTYGFGKATVFAALINGLMLVFASGAIVWEGVQRLMHPAAVQTTVVMITAALGVAINGGTALMFLRGKDADANIRGAFTHMAADAVISVGVIVSGLIVALTGAQWLDPLVSLVIVALILFGSLGLLRDAIDMALDAAPPSIDVAAVKRFLAQQPGVIEVHDLHVWAMGAAESALTAHLVRPDVGDDDLFLQDICAQVGLKFGIAHATIQIERQSFDCHPHHG